SASSSVRIALTLSPAAITDYGGRPESRFFGLPPLRPGPKTCAVRIPSGGETRIVKRQIPKPNTQAAGAKHSQQVLLRAHGVAVHLRISPHPLLISGQLMRRPDGDSISGARVELVHSGQPVGSTLTDALGNFQFKRVPEGRLRLFADIPSEDQLIADFLV